MGELGLDDGVTSPFVSALIEVFVSSVDYGAVSRGVGEFWGAPLTFMGVPSWLLLLAMRRR